ncbi:MAG TPA: S-adenosylmethionine decarboxylase [Bacteroidia bacterium]
MYKKGLHLISEFSVKDPELLKDCDKMKTFLNEAILKHGLIKVGEVFHAFPDSGYTGMICLTESHISIHTWPEFNMVTFDVFLSNYMKYNDTIAEKIHSELLALLDVKEINTTRLNR